MRPSSRARIEHKYERVKSLNDLARALCGHEMVSKGYEMNSNKITKKLMLEFFESMIRENFPGEGLRVGTVICGKYKRGFRHWEVQVFFWGQELEFDPLAWFKIRGIILGESFAVAMGKGPRVEVTVNLGYFGFSSLTFSSVQVAGWIRFEEGELSNLWPSLIEGKNPYD